MAVAAFTADNTQQYLSGAWAAMATGDTGAWVEVRPDSMVSVELLSGTIGGATITWEGSLEPSNPTGGIVIPDIKGVLMSQTALGILGPGQPIRWIRPVVTGGAASALVARLVAVRPC